MSVKQILNEFSPVHLHVVACNFFMRKRKLFSFLMSFLLIMVSRVDDFRCMRYLYNHNAGKLIVVRSNKDTL